MNCMTNTSVCKRTQHYSEAELKLLFTTQQTLYALHLHMQAQKHTLICDDISIQIYTECMQVLYS